MMKHPRLTLGIATVVIVLGTLGFTLLIKQDSVAPNSSSMQQDAPRKTEDKSLNGTSQITKVGIVVCLEPVQTGGQHTMECAFGLKEDDGTIYALRSDDPMLIGTVPTGQRVQISGTISSRSPGQYNAKDTIMVQTLQRL